MPNLPASFQLEPLHQMWLLCQLKDSSNNRKVSDRKMDVGFTIITRTSARPNFFARCRASLLSQTHKNYFHLVVSDDLSDKYPIGQGDLLLRVKPLAGRGHNTYFNLAAEHIPPSHPWVIFLDDDDELISRHALEIIANAIHDADNILLWQVLFPDCILPGQRFGLPPEPGQITGIGFCYHVSHWIDWLPLPLGDFAVIQELYQELRPVWINQILTGMQVGPGHGNRQDLEHGLRFPTP